MHHIKTSYLKLSAFGCNVHLFSLEMQCNSFFFAVFSQVNKTTYTNHCSLEHISILISGRLVVQYSSPDLDSSPDLSPFLLDLDLGKFVTKSIFNFHCAHLQCFV